MKVTHIVTRLGRGGTDHNVLHFVDWQRRHGHHPRLLVGQASDTTVAPSWLPVDVVQGLVRDPAPVADLRALGRLRYLLARQRPDVVHTHQSKAGIVGRLAAVGRAPVVVHTVHMASFGPAYGRSSAVFRVGERVCARLTDVVVPVGEELRRRYVQSGIGRPDQYLVVRSPVRLEAFLGVRELDGARRARIRQTLEAGPAVPVVLSVGFLEPRKRHDLLLRRLQPLLGSGRAALVVAGDGERRPVLERLATELGVGEAVRFLGHVEAVEDLFAVADVLVHTSAVEGVPQVVLQALAAGVPVVATETEGVREIPGAPVRVVDRSGAGLARAVEETLAHPPGPVGPEQLAEWTDEAVERQIAALHDRIEARLRSTGRGNR
ncbi:MAG TPA: glycosyltransferase [Acidimicrobiales bacterium]|nr:glycosyltransferase [Acidimicrobiales bacterium]